MGALGEPPLDELFSPSPGEGGGRGRERGPGGEGPGGGPTTEQRVLRSTFASYAIQLARLGINFGAKIALARLILPEGHGVYELALRIVTVASAVPRPRPALPAGARQAPPLRHRARHHHGPGRADHPGAGRRSAPALRPARRRSCRPCSGCFAVWVLLDGLAVVPRAFFERELTIGNLVAPEIVARRGDRRRLGGARLAGLGVLEPGDRRPRGRRAPRRLLLGQGVGEDPAEVRAPTWRPASCGRSFLLFLIWITLQLVTYIDIYIVDVVPRHRHTVGLYVRAYWIAFLVATIVYPRAFFPTLMEYLDDRPRFVEFFRLEHGPAPRLPGGGELLPVLQRRAGARHPPGENWPAAAPILRVLAFIPFFDQFTMLGGEMLKAEHRDRPLARDRAAQPGLAGRLRHLPHPALRRRRDGRPRTTCWRATW